MNQRFDEDRAELEQHFADRVQAYIELGDTPEQARLAALEKFGETEAVMRQLRRRRATRSPLLWAAVCASSSIVIALVSKHAIHQSAWISSMLPSMVYAIYFWNPRGRQVCR